MRKRHLNLLCAGGLILGAFSGTSWSRDASWSAGTGRQEPEASPVNERFERAAALETLEGTGNLRAAFNADKHKARLMVALSPT